jgi:GT2 family glycosyltransferase
VKVAVIVVTFNGMRWIEKCIQSISNSTYPIHPIFIDNASTDGTVTYIKNTIFSDNLISLDRNFGFGAANNLGIQQAISQNSDYVIFLNQDAWFENDIVGNLINLSSHDNSYAILSPIHLNANKKTDSLFLSYLQRNTELLNDLILENKKNIYPVPFINAAFWFVNINWVKKVGGFNPVFFMYGEDDNICSRIKYFGGKIGVCSDLYIVHDRADRVLSTLHKKNIFRTRLRNKLFDINIKSPFLSGVKFILMSFLSKKSFYVLGIGIEELFFFIRNLKNRKEQFFENAFLN